MRSVLKWVGIVLGGLAGLAVIAAAALLVISQAQLDRKVDVPTDHVTVPTDPASIKEGERLAHVYGCLDCHTADLSGRLLVDSPGLAQVYTANLTSGKGGIGSTFSDDDYIRVLRHGVRPDGTRVVIMPAQEFTHLNASTLGKIVAYLKSVPPVDHEQPGVQLGLLGRFLLVTGRFQVFPADEIDQTAPIPADVPPGPTVEYGKYLAQLCIACHGPGFSGGPIAEAPPGTPKAGNLTPDPSGLAKWSQDDFIRAMRTGDKPDGTRLASFMPWQSFKYMTDDELTALYLYLRTLPPTPAGNH